MKTITSLCMALMAVLLPAVADACIAKRLLLASLLIASVMGLPACSSWEASTYTYTDLPQKYEYPQQ